MSDPFYGRERELGILKELIDTNVARLVVLRGRRRIGKSRLAEKFGEFFNRHYTFVAVAVGQSWRKFRKGREGLEGVFYFVVERR